MNVATAVEIADEALDRYASDLRESWGPTYEGQSDKARWRNEHVLSELRSVRRAQRALRKLVTP